MATLAQPMLLERAPQSALAANCKLTMKLEVLLSENKWLQRYLSRFDPLRPEELFGQFYTTKSNEMGHRSFCQQDHNRESPGPRLGRA